MCKDNFAVYVRENAPEPYLQKLACPDAIPEINAYKTCASRVKKLDNLPIVYIIIFTLIQAWRDTAHAQNTRYGAKGSGPSSERLTEPAAAERPRRTIPGPGVLRSPRSCSGQVRDAAACRQRRTFHQHNCFGLRLLPSFVLPGPSCLRGERVSRFGPSETRTQTSAQTDTGDPGISPESARRRHHGKTGSLGTDGSGAVWGDDSCANYRARIASRSKKTALKSMAVVRDCSLIAQYEELRNHALAKSPVPRQCLGYVLFTRQGAAAWIRAWHSFASEPPAPTVSASMPHDLMPLDVRAQVALVLAGIILNLERQEVRLC